MRTRRAQTKMVCPYCGSENITHDAIVGWSIEQQCWEVADVLDNSECHDCESSGDWIEREIPL